MRCGQLLTVAIMFLVLLKMWPCVEVLAGDEDAGSCDCSSKEGD